MNKTRKEQILDRLDDKISECQKRRKIVEKEDDTPKHVYENWTILENIIYESREPVLIKALYCRKEDLYKVTLTLLDMNRSNITRRLNSKYVGDEKVVFTTDNFYQMHKDYITTTNYFNERELYGAKNIAHFISRDIKYYKIKAFKDELQEIISEIRENRVPESMILDDSGCKYITDVVINSSINLISKCNVVLKTLYVHDEKMYITYIKLIDNIKNDYIEFGSSLNNGDEIYRTENRNQAESDYMNALTILYKYIKNKII